MNIDNIDRYVCTSLEEMRASLKTLRPLADGSYVPKQVEVVKSTLFSLIEEAQTYVNRMENALEQEGRLKSVSETIRKLKKERKELKAEVVKLKGELDDLGGKQPKSEFTEFDLYDDMFYGD